jgi:NADPH:quinone reductase-like Zn-dependent oxidoreductase
MKAVVLRQFGGPEVLEHVDLPDPEPGPGQVLVRVKACALNHLDMWIRQGLPAYGTTLPHIPGSDVSGVIERLGPGVTHLKAGSRVVLAPGMACGHCGFCRDGRDNLCDTYSIRGTNSPGGYAGLTVARAVDVIPAPEALSFEEAAAYPLVFLTAWHMLAGRAKLQEGETVLVHAAGSGVGHAAVQIAKYLKATVYTTVGSDAKIPKAKALGADEVINYKKDDFEAKVKALTSGRGVDVVFEHIGPETWERGLRLLGKGGRLVTCGATSGPSVPLDLRFMFSRQLTVLGSRMGTRAELDLVTGLVGAKTLRPVVDTAFPLAEARAAHERMAGRDVFGKLVLVPGAH